MANGVYNIPFPENEPVLGYAPGSPEKAELEAAYQELYNSVIDVPMYIGDQEITTDNKLP